MQRGITSKQIFDYLGESVDENITVTGSRSDFDGSDCKSQSSDGESENQNTAMFRKRNINELKAFWTGKKVDASECY